MTIIAASILDADFSRLKEEIERIDQAGVDMFTLDIMDGHFAPRITFGEYVVSQIRRWTDLPLEAHLMVSKPENWAEKFIDAGVDLIVFHIEASESSQSTFRLIEQVRRRNRSVGLALLTDTPVDRVKEFVPRVDVVNFLAVPVGFGGQKSAPDTFDRVYALRSYAKTINPNLVIEVDGGVKPENAHKYVEAGATMLTVGTGIYHAKDPVRAVAQLKKATEKNPWLEEGARPRFVVRHRWTDNDKLRYAESMRELREQLDVNPPDLVENG